MKKLKFFLPVLMVVLLYAITLAPLSYASSMSLEFSINQWWTAQGGFLTPGHEWTETINVIGSQTLSDSPTATGSFSQQQPGVTYCWAFYMYASGGTEAACVGDGGDAGFSYNLHLDQSGTLRFSALTWEIKMLLDGSETTLVTQSADTALIANGGFLDGFGATSVLRNLSGYAEVPFTLAITGQVIDTFDAVPAPSTLLLMGSGMIPLVVYGRRTLVSPS